MLCAGRERQGCCLDRGRSGIPKEETTKDDRVWRIRLVTFKVIIDPKITFLVVTNYLIKLLHFQVYHKSEWGLVLTSIKLTKKCNSPKKITSEKRCSIIKRGGATKNQEAMSIRKGASLTLIKIYNKSTIFQDSWIYIIHWGNNLITFTVKKGSCGCQKLPFKKSKVTLTRYYVI